MASAQRDGKLVADLAAQRPALGIAQVMGIGGASTTDSGRAAGPQICTWSRSRTRRGSGKASTLLSIASRRGSAPLVVPVRAVARPSAVPLSRRGWPPRRQAPPGSPVAPGKRASMRWASAAVSRFFSGSDRCAHRAASSLQARSIQFREKSVAQLAEASIGASCGQATASPCRPARHGLLAHASIRRRADDVEPDRSPLAGACPFGSSVPDARSGSRDRAHQDHPRRQCQRA